MGDHQTIFKATLARYYKAERDRSETCMGDIVSILQDETAPDSDVVEQILERLVKHYSRDPQ